MSYCNVSSMSCLAGLDTVAIVLELNEQSGSSHQLPMFSTFVPPFDSTPFMIVSGPICEEDMPKPRSHPLAFCGVISPPKRSSNLSSSRFETTLPPLPDMPTLQMPSFSTFTHNEPATTRKFIPRIHHPNSPYVPWSSPMREEILATASSSISSSSSSLDVPSECYSRSGARAPEPPARQPLKTRVRRLCSRVRSAITRCLPGKARSRTTYPPPSSDSSSVSSSEYEPSLASNVDDIFPNRSHPTFESTESFDSCSLEHWLAVRMQQQSDLGCSGGMTLEEYEQQGSWLNVSRPLHSRSTSTSKTSTLSSRRTMTPVQTRLMSRAPGNSTDTSFGVVLDRPITEWQYPMTT